MSHLLYRHRLLWDGRRGVLALCGLYHHLTEPPAEFADAQYIDYAPEVAVAQIRTEHGAMRDMTPAEIGRAERALHAAFEGAVEGAVEAAESAPSGGAKAPLTPPPQRPGRARS